VRAVVLVGGEGTRLRPLTWTRPKQLLPVVGVAMLERVVEQLARAGVDEVVLSLGYRPEAFLAHYGSGRCGVLPARCVVEAEPLDTAGAIAFAAREAGIEEAFVAVNGDVLADVDLAGLLALHRRLGAAASIATVGVEDPSRFGVVVSDEAGWVRSFVEKPPAGTAPSNQINAGCYLLEPEALAKVEPGQRVSIEREVFPALAAEGRLGALAVEGYWLDTGTPRAYLQAHADYLAGRRGWPPSPGARELRPGVWVSGEATLAGRIEATSWLGPGAVVAAGARVRGSALGAGAQVGEGAEVVDAVLLPGARVGAGAQVRDSVVGEGAEVGAGASLRAETVVGDGAEVPEGAVLEGARLPDRAR
jgi:mannose-1-phosphate guanylyltransferase